MERDPRPMDNEDDPMPAPGVDVYDQPRPRSARPRRRGTSGVDTTASLASSGIRTASRKVRRYEPVCAPPN